ncbi:hypothetical protein RGR602_PC00597 (plasmid) [Rhizobium gallicum bv. gallicum R602sp]|uniref:Uncharacterized protein n=1 Tax=Rhizobium gallicum bv. gallicum R602sp TaxID=1041138 RepID=A0A0B4XBZ7_9HYPH|nr:hypothetical protein RGR602_PC00597 [Rhizobium gallicum bv. gallicum R602sp]
MADTGNLFHNAGGPDALIMPRKLPSGIDYRWLSSCMQVARLGKASAGSSRISKPKAAGSYFFERSSAERRWRSTSTLLLRFMKRRGADEPALGGLRRRTHASRVIGNVTTDAAKAEKSWSVRWVGKRLVEPIHSHDGASV